MSNLAKDLLAAFTALLCFGAVCFVVGYEIGQSDAWRRAAEVSR